MLHFVVALSVLVQSGVLWCFVLLEAEVRCSVHVSCAKDVLVQSTAERGALCYRVRCSVMHCAALCVLPSCEGR